YVSHSGAHLYLHSFPTRRSSDLGGGDPAGRAAGRWNSGPLAIYLRGGGRYGPAKEAPVGLFGQETQRLFIARPDGAKGQLVYKWPDTNIRKLTQLTVEQDELAVFFRDGKVQGTIQPGRCTLDSSEIPFLGILVDATTGGNFFKTELYFIATREFPSLPFGGAVDNVVDPQTSLGAGLRPC